MVTGGPTRRRIKTEEKTKVVAAVWGTEFFQFLAALDIIQEDDFEKRMNRIMSIVLGGMDALKIWMFTPYQTTIPY